MKVNQSNTESKKFQIPMVVTDEVIRDFGIKQEDVTWRRIGNRKCRVVMVDATEEEYRAYMAPIWAEIKREVGWPLHGQWQKRQADPLPGKQSL